MIIYLAMLLCGLGIAAMVYRYDMYDSEPLVLLAVAVVLGAAAVSIVGSLEDKFIESRGGWTVVRGSIAAAVFEESFKLLTVVLFSLGCRRFFNDPMDGLIYGAFVGLGFGIGESIFYVSEDPQASLAVLPVEAIRLFLHARWGGLCGYGIGLARFPNRSPGWPLWLAGGVGTAMLTHYLWDRYLGLVEIDDPMQARIVAISLMMSLTLAFGFLIVRGSTLSRQVHAPDSRKNIWGWPFKKVAPAETDEFVDRHK